MIYYCYKPLKISQYQSIGTFGDTIYAYEVLTGFAGYYGQFRKDGTKLYQMV